MKYFIKQAHYWLFFAVVLLVASCTPEKPIAEAVNSATPSPRTPTIAQTATSTFTPTDAISAEPTQTESPLKLTLFAIARITRTATIPAPTQTPAKPTLTPTPTATLPVFVPKANPGFAGTPVPGPEAINAENLTRLENVARWGKGEIIDMEVTNDGKTLVVGSAFGYEVYSLDKTDENTRWFPFETPIYYEKFVTSMDGQYLLLTWDIGDWKAPNPQKQIRRIMDGQIIPEDPAIQWNKEMEVGGYGQSISVKSPDGSKEFHGGIIFLDEGGSEGSMRDMLDTQGIKLYSLTDVVPDVTIYDRTEPEGCDLKVFSMCGNALAPMALVPYTAAFSSSGKSFAVLYRSASLSNSDRFSTLRTYRANDGHLLQMIGSFQQPVKDFAYIPGREEIIVAFVDGTIQHWDIGRNQIIDSFRHFSANIWTIDYSPDGKYLLVQRPETLEIRRNRDGVLIAEYPATAFAVSPVENRVAIGRADGSIQIEDIDRLRTVHHLTGHTAKIYALAFSPDGLLLSSAGEDCGLRVWDAQRGKFLHFLEKTVVNAHEEEFTKSRIFVKYMEFVPGTNQLAGSGSWGTAVSWNISSGAANYSVKSEPLQYYNGMVTLDPHFPEDFWLDAQNNRFFINGQGYNLQSGEKIEAYQPPEKLHGACSISGYLSLDGKLRFTRGFKGAEGRICVLDAQDYHTIQSMEVLPEGSPTGMIGWPRVSPDGKQIAIPIWGGQVYIYQVKQ